MRFELIAFRVWGPLHAKAMGDIKYFCYRHKLRWLGINQRSRPANPHAAVLQNWQRVLVDATMEAESVVVSNHLHARIGISAFNFAKHVLMGNRWRTR